MLKDLSVYSLKAKKIKQLRTRRTPKVKENSLMSRIQTAVGQLSHDGKLDKPYFYRPAIANASLRSQCSRRNAEESHLSKPRFASIDSTEKFSRKECSTKENTKCTLWRGRKAICDEQISTWSHPALFVDDSLHPSHPYSRAGMRRINTRHVSSRSRKAPYEDPWAHIAANHIIYTS